jgi:endoglucanase
MKLSPLTSFAILSLFAVCSSARASDIVYVSPLTDKIILIEFSDGKVNHHGLGQTHNDDVVITDPLNIGLATTASTYRLTEGTNTTTPTQIGRKSKGMDFAWYTDRWIGDRFVNDRPDHVKHHWLYLFLPNALVSGKTYKLSTSTLAKNGNLWTINYNQKSTVSEAVHVNLLGYIPNSSAKFAYIYHWMGDKGKLDFPTLAGKPFQVVNSATNAVVFSGNVAFRKSSTNAETNQANDTPNKNFNGADVYECDFSAFITPGSYVVSIPGVGASMPFKLDADIYRVPYRAVSRAIYHNRSGIALTQPYTEFVRPAPHNPLVTPGFAGKLRYSNLRQLDWGDGENPTNAAAAASLVGPPLTVSGWYQDAGDWDSYSSHLRVAQELMSAFQIAPKNFIDGENNIPESANGIPDILDEAAWLPRFCFRLRKELFEKKLGTGGIGLRIAGDCFGEDGQGTPSYKDLRTTMVSAEDPQSTYRYAGTAAQMAHCLKMINKKDPQGIDWEKEATLTYAWALKNTRPGDDAKIKTERIYASAAMFQLTGLTKYEEYFIKDTGDVNQYTTFWFEGIHGPGIYALAKGLTRPDSAHLKKIRDAVMNTATQGGINSPGNRAMRWGGNFDFPMLIGHQTTPWMMETAYGWALTRDSDPALAKQFLAAMQTTCDYFLGTNSMNMVMMTGVGPRNVTQMFHLDAWCNGLNKFQEGMIPYGQWRKQAEFGVGPWDVAWAHQTIYPSNIEVWPGNEQFFGNRNTPLGSEFTIHQNNAPAAAIFGILCGAKGSGERK